MLNRVILVGRMVRDPELRRTGTGVAVTSFTIAMNRNFTNQQGERQADFIPCVVWNKAAENTARYCGKGSLVGVEGRLQSRSYENQGKKVNVIEVICDSVQFLEPSSKQKGSNNSTSNIDTTEMYSKMSEEEIRKEFDNPTFDIMIDDMQF